jgi:predicted amidohydrolase
VIGPRSVAADRTTDQEALERPVRLRVAALQVGPFAGTALAAAAVLPPIDELAAHGVELIVLPELFAFRRDEIASDPHAAAGVSDALLAELCQAAASTGTWIVASLVEASDDAFYNTAYLIGSSGEVAGRYRQLTLWPSERAWATAGAELPVFSTPLGRIGLLVGYDCLMPEPARILAMAGADIIAVPAAWRAGWDESLAIVERAAENRVSVIAAVRPDSIAEGRRGSLVVAAERFPTTPHWAIRMPEPAYIAGGGARYVAASISPAHSRDKRSFENTDQIGLRRPEFYESLVR